MASLERQQLPETELTAVLAGPSSHDGTRFNVNLVLSEPISDGYRQVRDHAFTVTGGSITKAVRVNKTRVDGKWEASEWRLGVRPSGANDDVTLSAPGNRSCTERGALCTADDRSLSHPLSLTVPATMDASASEFDDDAGCNARDARSLPEGRSRTGSLEQGGDCDWFKTWVDYDKRYKVTLEGLSSSRSLRFIRASHRSTVPDAETPDSDANRTQIHVLPDWSGGLYIEVSSSSSETGGYTLSIEEDPEMTWSGSEPPDLPGDTSTWAVVEVGDTVNGRYACGEDNDWYRIDLDADASVQVDLAAVANSDVARRLLDPVLRVMDGDGELLEVAGSFVIDDDSGGGSSGKDAKVTISAGSSDVTRYIEARFGQLLQTDADPPVYTGQVRPSPFCGRYVLSLTEP